MPPAQSELAERIPEPPNPHEKVRKWSVGVTTAPRRETTLETCLERLVTAGWDEWTVFAEPESEIPHRYRTKTCWRKRRLHAWPNFYLGLAELFMVEPDADAYFMLQDDALLCKDRVREYLESVMWPEHPSRIGFISLYTSAAYARAQAGWYRQEGEPWRWGALALLFPASSVRSLLSSPLVINHRLSPAGTKCIDRVLGDWAWHMRLNNWITTPSLVRHSGDTSTIRGHSVNDGFRQASIAVEP